MDKQILAPFMLMSEDGKISTVPSMTSMSTEILLGLQASARACISTMNSYRWPPLYLDRVAAKRSSRSLWTTWRRSEVFVRWSFAIATVPWRGRGFHRR